MADASNPLPEATDLRPSVDDVAGLLRARTKDTEGREVGTFNDETRPTAEQVETHIDAAMGLVGVRFPTLPDVPEYQQAFSSLVAYRAAMRIEKSYFPEQVRSDRSPYEELRQEYVDDLQALIDAIAEIPDAVGTPGRRAHSEWTPSFLRIFGTGGWVPGPPYPPWYDHWPEPENPANWRDPFQPPRQPPEPGDLPVGDEPASGRTMP
jgi:hypothetical protein